MTCIFKYPLPMEVFPGEIGWDPQVHLRLPYGAVILAVQAQDNEPMIWAEVDPLTDRREARRFYILPTGAELPGGKLKYIGTIQINGGKFIFHIYEDRS